MLWCSCFLLFRWWGCTHHLMQVTFWRRCAKGTRVSWTSRECIAHCSAGLKGIFLLPNQKGLYITPLNAHVSGGPRDGFSQTWGQGQSSGSLSAPHDIRSLISAYCKHGLLKIHFFHHFLEEELFSPFPLPPTTKKFPPSEEVINECGLPCDKTRFSFFLCKRFMKSPWKSPSGEGSACRQLTSNAPCCLATAFASDLWYLSSPSQLDLSGQ